MIAAETETGISPLDYLLQVMRDPSGDSGARLEAAKAAAPYVHPKLSAIEHSTDPAKSPGHYVPDQTGRSAGNHGRDRRERSRPAERR